MGCPTYLVSSSREENLPSKANTYRNSQHLCSPIREAESLAVEGGQHAGGRQGWPRAARQIRTIETPDGEEGGWHVCLKKAAVHVLVQSAAQTRRQPAHRVQLGHATRHPGASSGRCNPLPPPSGVLGDWGSSSLDDDGGRHSNAELPSKMKIWLDALLRNGREIKLTRFKSVGGCRYISCARD